MDARPSQLRKTSRIKDSNSPIRVMIVDDSLTVRTIFSRMVEDEGGMEIVGTFSNAERALVKLRDLDVDVILLDLEMPGMGGLEALPKILTTAENAQVLVVSSLTQDGAEHTLSALSMGAADTMLKPRPGGFDNIYRASLLEKIRALGTQDCETQPAASGAARTSARTRARSSKDPELVAVGASTGGIHALNAMLRCLPPSFDLPIVVTQHLPGSFMPVFARQLEVASARRSVVASHGSELRRGEILIAPGDGHLSVVRKGERLLVELSSNPASSGCMPSVDPMLSSIAETLGGHAIAVILSGMGRDGVEGAGRLAEAGGSILVQDAETSAVWGMPGSVAKAGLASAIEPPEKIAEMIVSLARVPAWK